MYNLFSWIELIELHYAVYKILHFLGIIPYTIKGSRLRFSRFLGLKTFSLLVLSAVIFVISSYKSYLNKGMLQQVRNILGFVTFTRITASANIVLVTVVNIYRNRRKHIKLMEKLQNANFRLTELNLDCRRSKWKIGSLFLIVILYEAAVDGIFTVVLNSNGQFWMIIFWSSFAIHNFFSNICIFYISKLIMDIKHSLTVLKLGLASSEIDPVSLKVKFVYEDLKKTTRLLNKTFGFVLLIHTFYDFCFIVTQTFVFILYFMEDPVLSNLTIHFAQFFIRIVPSCAKMYALNDAATRVGAEFVKVKKLLLPPLAFENADLINVQVLADDNQITAFGFFEISLKQLFENMSAIFLYSLIIVQFQYTK